MKMQIFSSMLIAVALASHTWLNAWMIEHIQNELPYSVRVEFSKMHEVEPASYADDMSGKSIECLDIASGTRVPFGEECPFAQDLIHGFDDFENLPTTLSIAPTSHPLCRGFIAEGVFAKQLRIPATMYYQEGSPKPRCYIVSPTLGYMAIRSDSRNIYATLRLYEKDCISAKKGNRKRMLCELIHMKFKTIDGHFSKKIDDVG